MYLVKKQKEDDSVGKPIVVFGSFVVDLTARSKGTSESS